MADTPNTTVLTSRTCDPVRRGLRLVRSGAAFLPEDAKLHLGKMATHAVVDAVAEGDVSLSVGPVDVDLVGTDGVVRSAGRAVVGLL
jgi:hypothetical protein